MPVIQILLGIVLLLFGRPLYWAFVAVAGFLVGFELAEVALADQPAWLRIVVALAGGTLGGLLGLIAQRVAFALAGLFAGGYLALSIAQAAELGGNPWIWFILGGVLGAIVAVMVMDWAIIVLSSLAGAAAIVSAFALSQTIAALLFIALAIFGIVIQSRRLQPPPSSEIV